MKGDGNYERFIVAFLTSRIVKKIRKVLNQWLEFFFFSCWHPKSLMCVNGPLCPSVPFSRLAMASWRSPMATGCAGPACWASTPSVCCAPRRAVPWRPQEPAPSGHTSAAHYGSQRYFIWSWLHAIRGAISCGEEVMGGGEEITSLESLLNHNHNIHRNLCRC